MVYSLCLCSTEIQKNEIEKSTQTQKIRKENLYLWCPFPGHVHLLASQTAMNVAPLVRPSAAALCLRSTIEFVSGQHVATLRLEDWYSATCSH